jgi:hypothetical protein
MAKERDAHKDMLDDYISVEAKWNKTKWEKFKEFVSNLFRRGR